MNRVLLSTAAIQGQGFRSLSSITKDYQFIQKSSVPTLHFQPSLPRLPVPTLEKTCERYLRAQRPLLDDNQFKEVEKLTSEFREGEGTSLQKELIDQDKRNRHTSYIAKPWFDMYLSDRRPLPINYNPFLVFINDPKKDYNTQLIRSTNLLISSLRFMKSLRANLIEPEVYHLNPAKSDTKLFRTVTGLLPSSISWYGAYLFKAFPLDMSQYKHLMGTCRIPQPEIDTLHHDPTTSHITVQRGGKFYKLRVLDQAGDIVDAGVLYTCLKCILESKSPNEPHPVGVLTTENRNVWAKARDHLLSIGNVDALKEIEGALFNLVLDENGLSDADYPSIIRQYLHSDGKNRFFDKSFSLIVDNSGIAGVNFEHSWGDGIAVLRYFQDIYKDSVENPQVHPDSSFSSCQLDDYVSDINFSLDDEAKVNISDAIKNFQKTTSSLGIEVNEFHDFGRNLCKKHKISPDFLMQLSFQMAHHKLANRFVSTYESCSTSAFKHGRTETMRPLTVESKDLCQRFSSKTSASNDGIIKLMKAASDIHGNLIKEAAMGQGFDRHMFALKLLSEKRGNLPSLFAHPSYKQLNHYILSTSTLTSDVVMLGAFGPVVPDGFGVGYSIWNERLGAIVSNYKGKTDGSGFINCWQSSLNELHNVLK
ncbi:Carnitine O-palmitoyltransferase 2 [Nesidiocoris tenuis]|uniref:Carnitine O-palmitoyltransferase 2 n=1 Tax=Nesidiocoris tenuis TaxID=355587 RepID=A0ABN7AIR8_9HEMI|nr:Carnitine O-palmitoyltransferase 2 [Nesidiocoris tenuis]